MYDSSVGVYSVCVWNRPPDMTNTPLFNQSAVRIHIERQSQTYTDTEMRGEFKSNKYLPIHLFPPQQPTLRNARGYFQRNIADMNNWSRSYTAWTWRTAGCRNMCVYIDHFHIWGVFRSLQQAWRHKHVCHNPAEWWVAYFVAPCPVIVSLLLFMNRRQVIQLQWHEWKVTKLNWTKDLQMCSFYVKECFFFVFFFYNEHRVYFYWLTKPASILLRQHVFW